MSYLERVDAALDEIRTARRYRVVETRGPASTVDFGSNDYLAFATDPRVVQALRRAVRVGSGGSRLLGGCHPEHTLLEEELAAWLGRERALLFSSGYHAALGTIPVLAGLVETISSDALNHASLIDGMRLARAPRRIYPHTSFARDLTDSDSTLVITESIFGMDGDAVDLSKMLSTLRENDVLLVDEAHAIGIAGPEGAGLAREIADPRVIVMGTLSKAFGAHGGFVAGPAALIELLVNQARTFIFDTALPPAVALAARISLALIRRAGDRRVRLHENTRRLRDGLTSLGIGTGAESRSPVVPVIIGEEQRTVAAMRALLERRVCVPAVRPPTVPQGSSRLRFSLRCDHTCEQIDVALQAIAECIAIS
jgi:8-amino-7-oxononanoate synthase